MIHRLILALLLVVAGMLGVAMWRMEKNRGPNLAEVLEGLRSDKVNLTVDNTFEGAEKPMLVAKWTDTDGIQREVRTSKGEPGFEDETEEQFQDRHDARVRDQLDRYPKA